ncbi:MAG: hypothetical protein M3O50_11280 [Myxococcota bacterium]|nr:hypothetical protein [Myxococcota bacterium]
MIHCNSLSLGAFALIWMSACGGRSTQLGATSASLPGDETESSDSGTGGDAVVVTGDEGGTFACGTMATCDGRLQACEHVRGGPPPGVDFYECIPIPAACNGVVSCACVTTALRGRGANACSAAANHFTVQIDVP